VPLLTRVFTYFKLERLPGETLGDFCHRKGKDDILAYEEKLISQDTAPSTITRAAS
jgi:sulfite reductase beta subunit-like hemoprotein